MRLRCRPALKLGQKPLSPLPAKRGQTRDTDLELQQRLGAIGTPGIGGTGSASLPSGYAKSFARTPLQDQHHGAQDAPAHPANRARAPPEPPPVVPLIPDKRYYGGAPGYGWGSGDGPES